MMRTVFPFWKDWKRYENGRSTLEAFPQKDESLIYEIVDNSVDEHLAGYCTQIEVYLEKDGSCTVTDNGRGIPVGMHAKGMSRSDWYLPHCMQVESLMILHIRPAEDFTE